MTLRASIFTTILATISITNVADGENLSNNYLAASMQALAHCIDHLQYHPLSHSDSMNSSTMVRNIKNSADNFATEPFWLISIPSPSTTFKPSAPPTIFHKPSIFADITKKEIWKEAAQEYKLVNGIGGNPQKIHNLPFSLLKDVTEEMSLDNYQNDRESLDNFLRIYDDNYGKVAFDAALAGLRRLPPTKPYVDFVLVYDLLRRTAKSFQLNDYDGYSQEFLDNLYNTSRLSSAQQLCTLLEHLLEQRAIQRRDIVVRVRTIIEDLKQIDSITVNALRHVPALIYSP